MTSKELTTKVSVSLRKANRLKSLHAQLERIDDVIARIRDGFPQVATVRRYYPVDHPIQDDSELGYIENCLELCYIHKLKFQLDAVLDGVKNTFQQLRQDPQQLDQALFNQIMQRLQTVLAIDVTHREAQDITRVLRSEYPAYTQHFDTLALQADVRRYQLPDLCLEMTCSLQDLEAHEQLRAQYTTYQVAPQDDAPLSTCRLRFYAKDLQVFDQFHEVLRVRPSYQIAVNHQVLDEQIFSEWFQCYKRFLKSRNPLYCYGASPLTYNWYGCHKLRLKDVAKTIEQSWFHYATFDQQSELFFLDKQQIIALMQRQLEQCGFCPALHQKKIALGFSVLPGAINPACDQRWELIELPDQGIGVLPVGDDLVIALPHPQEAEAAESEHLIEVGETPYMQKVLRYLSSGGAADLSEPAYQGLSKCMVCGNAYKPHTMICSKCKTPLWKQALKDLAGTLRQLRATRSVALQPWRVDQSDAAAPAEQPEASAEDTGATVSFDQLWDDPQIQEILARPRPDSDQHEVVQEPPEADQIPFDPSARPAPRQAKPPDRFDFSEKLRGLIPRTYRERKALEQAFSHSVQPVRAPEAEPQFLREQAATPEQTAPLQPESAEQAPPANTPENKALRKAIKSLKPRQRSELSKRGVVRVIYHASMDKETCPLCAYLDGMVMDPDDPATDIFSPPLFPGCTCRREYVLKTEKPKNWPEVTFKFPPKELLIYLDKE